MKQMLELEYKDRKSSGCERGRYLNVKVYLWETTT